LDGELTNWEIFGTAKPYGPSVQRMVDGGWISVGRPYKGRSLNC